MNGLGANNGNSNNELLTQSLTKAIPEWCSLIKYAMVKLYFADKSHKFKYSQQSGAICLILDRKQYSTKYLKLYDVSNFTVLFELEMYLNFSATYRKHTSEFYIFPVGTGWGGFLFQNADEAHSFNDKIEQFSDNATADAFKKNLDWLSKGTLSQLLASASPLNPLIPPLFLNRAYFKKAKIPERPFFELASVHISKPISIKRESNAGWDPINQNFKLDELPKELKQLLRRAGITKKDLKEKAIALMVYEILINPRQLDSILAKMKGPVKGTSVVMPGAGESPKKEIRRELKASVTSVEDIMRKHSGFLPGSITAEDSKAAGPIPGEDATDPLRKSKSIVNIPVPTIGIPLPPMITGSSVIMAPPTIPGNFLDEIRAKKFNLKKPEANKNTVFKDLIDNKELRMKAASTLHAAIVERRGQLTKNAAKDSDEEDDDGWSDDDE